MTQHPKQIDNGVTFRLVRYNPIRKQRGAPAVEIEIEDESNIVVLWMDETDLKRNVKLYGPHEALLEAQIAYMGNEPIAYRNKGS